MLPLLQTGSNYTDNITYVIRAKDSIAATPTRLDVTLDRVSIGYVFMKIVKESETCHVYKTVLLTI
jgi:hypothetical protein